MNNPETLKKTNIKNNTEYIVFLVVTTANEDAIVIIEKI